MLFNPDEALKDYPCSFNLITLKKVSRKKFRHIRGNIERDLDDSITSEENVRILNLLTLVLFNLDQIEEALKKNAEVLGITNRQNITALGNYMFILCKKGDQINARNYFIKELQPLTKEKTFDVLRTEAFSEQAYSYLKLGGFENIQFCIKLFKECVEKCPKNYMWKYGLGLAYRRLTNSNLSSYHEEIDVNEKTEECARLLFDVAENGDGRLRGLAYAQLVELRQYSDHPEPEVIFKGLDNMKLLEKALENDGENYTVLTMCGMGIKEDDLDKAIELLRKSAELRDYSMTFHHLGLCLWKKARLSKSCHKDEESNGAKDEDSFPEPENCCPSQESGQISGESDCLTSSDTVGKSTTSGIVKMCSVDSLIEITSISTSHLDKTDPLIKDAIFFFEESFNVSHQQNIPAKVSLGDLYMDLHDFEKALEQYCAIISELENDYLICQITAHEKAGKCLKNLNESLEQSDSDFYKKKAKEHFKKALGLAADLSSRNAKYKNCETDVWNAFKLLLKDVQEIAIPKEYYKELVMLLKLAQNQDIAEVIKEMLEEGLELDDIEMFHTGLKSYLKNRDFEGAHTFLRMASTKSALINNDLWNSPELAITKASTYISTSWLRLTKRSVDCRRIFQQMFQMKYGHWTGMVSGEDEETEVKKSDVLLVNDFSANSEDDLDATSILAINLTLALSVIFGLDTSYIESKIGFGQPSAESQLQEMEHYSLVVVIIGDNDGEEYDAILKALHAIEGTRFLVLSYRQDGIHPHMLLACEVINITQEPWLELRCLITALLDQTTPEAEKEDILWARIMKDVFKEDNEVVMRLFCHLVEEDFEKHCKSFKDQSKVSFN